MRRRPTTSLVGVGVPVLAALVLGACTAPAPPSGPATPTATTATATGTGTPTTTPPVQLRPLVVETHFDFTTLDPVALVDRSGLFVAGALYETLTTLDPADPTTVLPGLAEYTLSPERNWLTLRLRPDATFSDGSRVTSDDVIFTLARARGLGGVPGQLLGPISLTKVDDRTLTVTSPGPNFVLPAVLANPAFGILNADVVKTQGAAIGPGDSAGGWLAENSAGSGPYVIADVDPGRSVTLEPNPRWSGARPAFGDVIIRNATPARQVRDIETGAADVVLDLPPGRADAMKLQPEVSTVAITSQTSSTIAFLMLNRDKTVNTWTADPHFATAVRLGLDIEAIVAAAGPGAQPALGLVPSGLPGAFEVPEPPATPSTAATTPSTLPAPATPSGTPTPATPTTPPPMRAPAPGSPATSVPTSTTATMEDPSAPRTAEPTGTDAPIPTVTPTAPPVRDVAAAKAALARSGYRGAPIRLTYASDRPLNGIDLAGVAKVVRGQLAQVGIRVTLAPTPLAKARAALDTGKTPFALWSWAPEFAEAEAALAFGPGGHLGRRAGWILGVDGDMSALTEATRSSFGEERPGAFARWQVQMNLFGPFVPLFQPAAHHAHGERVTELPRSPLVAIDLARVR
ncbi:ABC transporter substrate-binding protein [Intrasporangium sp.]|uniref:ABC transporter substrate-binding protein n=1 Tax=Intrasporangium sp. TaxID=1925024 RepID=UPI002939EBD4|nr:ABC transporter substrate-binding protein [Intrasporangium sp.]MDV3222916.1 ABC transporter substrate-binding protein [Intrasporangium sp.]